MEKLKNQNKANKAKKTKRIFASEIKRRFIFFMLMVFLFLSLMTFYQSGFAMLVEDPTEWAKTIEVISQLKDQYDQLTQQLDQLKSQYNAVTGNYGWGNWNNSLNDLQQGREFTAPDWQSALQGMSGGNPERYQQLLDQYKQEHVAMNPTDYAKGTDDNLSKSYQNEVQTNQASATTSTYEFNDINKHLQTLYQLGQQIEDAKKNNDLKAAMDLNSRVQLEVGYVAVEELRMQTVLNQQMAQTQSAKIAMENEASQYNQAGENP